MNCKHIKETCSVYFEIAFMNRVNEEKTPAALSKNDGSWSDSATFPNIICTTYFDLH